MAEKSRSKTASDGRSKRRKLWDDQDMKSAMSAVRAGELSISAASSRFSVPRKTLDDRMKGTGWHMGQNLEYLLPFLSLKKML